MKIILVGLLLVSGFLNAEVIHEEDSLYQHIVVSESDGMRCLFFVREETGIKNYQGCQYTLVPYAQVLPFSKGLLGSLLLNPDPKRILVIGLGVGTTSMALRQYLPNAYIENVEIDPAVVDVAKKYFKFNEDAKMKIYIADGRVFVNDAVKKKITYDLIVLDAMSAHYIPDHMMTKDFLLDVKSLLTSDGVLAANTFARSQLYHHESTTYSAVFGAIYNLKMDKDKNNRIILAAKNGRPAHDVIRNNAKTLARFYYGIFGIDVNELLVNMDDAVDWDETARVLTDDYSPANLLQSSQTPVSVVKALVFIEDSLRDYFMTTIAFLLLIIGILSFMIGKLIEKSVGFFKNNKMLEPGEQK